MPETALITGASGGIGLELAKLFARDQINLVLVARSENKLHEIAREFREQHGIEVQIFARDLATPAAAEEARALHDELAQSGIVIDYLVNNAGYGLHGKFLDLGLDSQLDMLRLNSVALTAFTDVFARGMMARGKGRILNVASTAAFQPGPLMAVYYASKSYVLHFSEALANELKGSGVTVTCLCPGPTPTGFQARAGNQKSGLLTLAQVSAESVAKSGYRAMMFGKPLAIPGLLNRIGVFFVRFLPRTLVTTLARKAADQVKS